MKALQLAAGMEIPSATSYTPCVRIGNLVFKKTCQRGICIAPKDKMGEENSMQRDQVVW